MNGGTSQDRTDACERGLAAAGFGDVAVEFTHQVADGMHSAIIKAVKRQEPR